MSLLLKKKCCCGGPDCCDPCGDCKFSRTSSVELSYFRAVCYWHSTLGTLISSSVEEVIGRLEFWNCGAPSTQWENNTPNLLHAKQYYKAGTPATGACDEKGALMSDNPIGSIVNYRCATGKWELRFGGFGDIDIDVPGASWSCAGHSSNYTTGSVGAGLTETTIVSIVVVDNEDCEEPVLPP